MYECLNKSKRIRCSKRNEAKIINVVYMSNAPLQNSGSLCRKFSKVNLSKGTKPKKDKINKFEKKGSQKRGVRKG